MTILSRYLFKQFFRFFSLWLGAFMMVYLLIDIIDRIRGMITYKASFPDAAVFFLFKLPMIFYQVCPVAVVVSVILTIGMMVKNRELIAIQASGLGPGTVVGPLMAASVLVTGMVGFNNEIVLPPAIRISERVWNVNIKKTAGKVMYRTNELWLRGEGGVIWHARYFDPADDGLKQVTLLWVGEGMAPLRRIDAREADYDPGTGQWRVTDGREWTFAGGEVTGSRAFATLSLPLAQTPADFKVVDRHADAMSLRDLAANIRDLAAEGFKTNHLRVQLATKTATPFISIIVAGIGIALGFSSRAIALGGALAVAVIIAFSYWALLAVAMALGSGGILPPALAGWIANLIFAAAGVLLLLGGRHRLG